MTKEEQQSSVPHTLQQGEMITHLFQLPWEGAVGVHGAVLYRKGEEGNEFGLKHSCSHLALKPDSKVKSILEYWKRPMGVFN